MGVIIFFISLSWYFFPIYEYFLLNFDPTETYFGKLSSDSMSKFQNTSMIGKLNFGSNRPGTLSALHSTIDHLPFRFAILFLMFPIGLEGSLRSIKKDNSIRRRGARHLTRNYLGGLRTVVVMYCPRVMVVRRISIKLRWGQGSAEKKQEYCGPEGAKYFWINLHGMVDLAQIRFAGKPSGSKAKYKYRLLANRNNYLPGHFYRWKAKLHAVIL